LFSSFFIEFKVVPSACDCFFENFFRINKTINAIEISTIDDMIIIIIIIHKEIDSFGVDFDYMYMKKKKIVEQASKTKILLKQKYILTLSTLKFVVITLNDIDSVENIVESIDFDIVVVVDSDDNEFCDVVIIIIVVVEGIVEPKHPGLIVSR
jgi:hypothetical protein